MLKFTQLRKNIASNATGLLKKCLTNFSFNFIDILVIFFLISFFILPRFHYVQKHKHYLEADSTNFTRSAVKQVNKGVGIQGLFINWSSSKEPFTAFFLAQCIRIDKLIGNFLPSGNCAPGIEIEDGSKCLSGYLGISGNGIWRSYFAIISFFLWITIGAVLYRIKQDRWLVYMGLFIYCWSSMTAYESIRVFATDFVAIFYLLFYLIYTYSFKNDVFKYFVIGLIIGLGGLVKTHLLFSIIAALFSLEIIYLLKNRQTIKKVFQQRAIYVFLSLAVGITMYMPYRYDVCEHIGDCSYWQKYYSTYFSYAIFIPDKNSEKYMLGKKYFPTREEWEHNWRAEGPTVPTSTLFVELNTPAQIFNAIIHGFKGFQVEFLETIFPFKIISKKLNIVEFKLAYLIMIIIYTAILIIDYRLIILFIFAFLPSSYFYAQIFYGHITRPAMYRLNYHAQILVLLFFSIALYCIIAKLINHSRSAKTILPGKI